MDRAALFASINRKLAANDIEGAIDEAEVAIALGEAHPTLLNLCAHRLEARGDFAGALQLLDRALALDPADATILSAIGHVWLKQAAPQNALRAFAAAIGRDPGFAPAHHGAGLALWGLGDLAASRLAQERAAALDSRYPDPRGALALLALHENRTEEAGEHARAALALQPDEPAATLTLASLEHEAGRHEAVAAMLPAALEHPQLAPLQRAALLRIHADSLDALGRYDAAFEAYAAGNALQRRIFAPQHEGPGVESSTGLCERIGREFAREPDAFGGAGTGVRPDVNHVFLLGFPRSGTTLLEQVLASHAGVDALEEKPTLTEEIADFFLAHDTLHPLASLTPADQAARAQAYWSRIDGYGVETAGRTFVDKQPSLTQYLPMIAKLFPRAKIIVARRDPRDVVLSCFRRGFNMNRTIYDFTDLERLATYYAATMTLAESYMAALPLTFHVHSHEAMVADFDGAVGGLCGSLGISFDENMRNFVETAKGREIRTPSARQVMQGMNASGVGYWRNYARHLAPVMPILEPWIQRFGYA